MNNYEGSNHPSIACLGECMIELSGQRFGEVKQGWGGDSYNTAVYLRRLLPDSISVSYLTAVGDDPLSQELVNRWQSNGIDTRYVKTISGKTSGIYQILVDSKGERRFVYWRNDSAAKYQFDDRSATEIARELSSFGWVYLSGISLAVLTDKGRSNLLAALNLYHQQGGRIVFDSNYRSILWESKAVSQKLYREIAKISDIALLTYDDEQTHFNATSTSDVFNVWYCSEVVIKRGHQPCLIRFENSIVEVDAEHVSSVVDTTAAGDSFGAGYIAGRVMGCSVASAASLGHQVAAQVIQYPGAVIPETATAHIKMGDFV
ncbi:sugar kinase [Reinekea sp. G2M2-21]|uniref:sugar kinase n=1 Tax=Reinekea sp. G2M2-21 TaxID=2788942 RepID=UPI0018A9E2F0|nr:sugar kinase [Reinekea sp. G2M2-21]